MNSWRKGCGRCELGHGKKMNEAGDDCGGNGAAQRADPRRHGSSRQRTATGGELGHQRSAHVGRVSRAGRALSFQVVWLAALRWQSKSSTTSLIILVLCSLPARA